jgi:hypothetical protein
MTGRMQRPVMTLGTVACVYAGAAAAQEYCVACTEPDALYRCVIDGARPGGGQSLQLLCVTTMAKSGGHATCTVKGGTVFDCNAPIKRVPWVASDRPPQPGGAQLPAVPPATQSSVPAKPEEPPKTMVELAKRANEQTSEQMKKAGETVKSTGQAIGEATKKTWDCVISFFTHC